MSCALARADGPTAREIYFQLPESQRNMTETRHLAFKAALRMNDTAWAAESLELVAKSAEKDPTRLYACVVDAMHAGDDRQAYQALAKVFEMVDSGVPQGVHLPALLRCMIRMVQRSTKEHPNDNRQLNEAVSTMATLFEVAINHTTRFPDVASMFRAEELSWFSKNSYNTALESLEKINPQVILRLCIVSGSLIERLDRDTPPAEKTSLQLRHIFCEYLAMTVLVVLARNEDDIEHSHNCYSNAMKHGEKLRGLISDQMSVQALGDHLKADLVAKHIQSVKFELEASLRLQKWEALTDLFALCWTYDDPKRWSTLADLAFSIHEELCEQKPEVLQKYQQVVLKFTQQILYNSYKPGEPIEKLAKHLRCFFHLTLTKDNGFASGCVDQIIAVAKQVKVSPAVEDRVLGCCRD